MLSTTLGRAVGSVRTVPRLQHRQTWKACGNVVRAPSRGPPLTWGPSCRRNCRVQATSPLSQGMLLSTVVVLGLCMAIQAGLWRLDATMDRAFQEQAEHTMEWEKRLTTLIEDLPQALERASQESVRNKVQSELITTTNDVAKFTP